MRAELVWITPNCEQVIVDCARVSSPSNQGKDGEHLIKYLIAHKHWSPLEMASACVSIDTSRAIAAQLLRHRSFSFQEFSTRYSSPEGVEPIELRRQALKNRQSSDYPIVGDSRLDGLVEGAVNKAWEAYEALLKANVARECARMVLPLATSTTLYMAGTLRSFVHYVQLRTEPDTQKEHREIADEIREILWGQVPTIARALGWEW